VCRGALSRSAEVCERLFRGESADNATIDEATVLRTACDEAFWAVLHRRGLRLAGYELAHAVLVALAEPDAEARWRRGKDVFAAVRAEALAVAPKDEAFWGALWAVAHGDPVAPGPYAPRFPEWCR
jgi:hypothetical protein